MRPGATAYGKSTAIAWFGLRRGERWAFEEAGPGGVADARGGIASLTHEQLSEPTRVAWITSLTISRTALSWLNPSSRVRERHV